MSEREPRRPGSVTAAGWTAIIGSVATGTFLVVGLGTLVDREAPGSAGFTARLVAGIVWCVVATLLAVLTMHRSAAARTGLTVSAVIAGSISLTASAFIAAAFLTLVACAATIVLLLTGSARAWFRDVP